MIDFVKLDIEGAEWSTLRQMTSLNSLRNVKQLAVEVHLQHGRLSRQMSVEHWNTLTQLESAGFRRWSSRPNSVAKLLQTFNHLAKIAQHELVYVNERFVTNHHQREAV